MPPCPLVLSFLSSSFLLPPWHLWQCRWSCQSLFLFLSTRRRPTSSLDALDLPSYWMERIGGERSSIRLTCFPHRDPVFLAPSLWCPPFPLWPRHFASSSAFLGTCLATCKPCSVLCLPNPPWGWGAYILSSHYDCWASLLTLVWVFIWLSRMPSYPPQSNNLLKTGF